MLIAASILFVLAAGGGLTYYMLLPPKLDFNQPAWEKLCLSYHGWFGDFLDHFADDATKRKFSASPYPPEITRFISDAGTDLDLYQPKTIARQPSVPLDELAVHPTDYAKKGYGPYYTKKGDELIDSITGTLTPDHWPLLKNLDDTATTYTQARLEQPAAGIRRADCFRPSAAAPGNSRRYRGRAPSLSIPSTSWPTSKKPFRRQNRSPTSMPAGRASRIS